MATCWMPRTLKGLSVMYLPLVRYLNYDFESGGVCHGPPGL